MELVRLLGSVKNVFFIHVHIRVQLYHITIDNFLEANGGVGSGDFFDTFPFASGFLGSSIHYVQ